MTFDHAEVRLVRAALFTIEHYMDSVWDETEVAAVSGYSVSHFVTAREQIDGLRTAEDRRLGAIEDVRVGLERLEMFDDGELEGRRLRTLRATVEAAKAHGIPVNERLQKLAQSR
ncbi:hypothetical protein [Nocardioides dilutus]